jgi:hypothetical protein
MANRIKTEPPTNGKPTTPDAPLGAYTPPTAGDPAPDPFDVDRLRLPMDDVDMGVEELLVSVVTVHRSGWIAAA